MLSFDISISMFLISIDNDINVGQRDNECHIYISLPLKEDSWYDKTVWPSQLL